VTQAPNLRLGEDAIARARLRPQFRDPLFDVRLLEASAFAARRVRARPQFEARLIAGAAPIDLGIVRRRAYDAFAPILAQCEVRRLDRKRVDDGAFAPTSASGESKPRRRSPTIARCASGRRKDLKHRERLRKIPTVETLRAASHERRLTVINSQFKANIAAYWGFQQYRGAAKFREL
jgi:hypothetical protein